MSYFANLWDMVESYFVDNFETAAVRTSEVPVIFIDPNELAGKTHSEATAILKAQMETRLPGSFTALDVSTDMLTTEAAQGFPFAFKFEYEGEDYCLINKPASNFDEKHEMAPLMAATSIENLAAIPGDDYSWNRAIGIHEGTHCNQDFNDAANPEPKYIQTLERETVADKAALDYLERRGEREMAQTFVDYRALRAFIDPEHATSALVDDEEIEAIGEHYYAAYAGRDAMIMEVKAQYDLSYDQAKIMLKEDPDRFLNGVEQGIEEGCFDANPILKEYIENFVEAHRRQILTPESPKSEEPGVPVASNVGRASEPVIMAGALKDEIHLSGMTAREYFRSHADPVLAAQKLESQPDIGQSTLERDTDINSTAPLAPVRGIA